MDGTRAGPGAAQAGGADGHDRQGVCQEWGRGEGGHYRWLVALSYSLLPGDVEKLLPEILKELEAGGDGNQGLGLVDASA